MLIRRETDEDRDAVEAVISAAFGRPGNNERPPETLLLAALRRDAGWIPSLSMVAVRGDRIVGHVVCTRGWVDDTSALGLGPIGVMPRYQRRGIGHALMHAVVGAADAAGEPLIGLLGDRRFYGRFGFVPASQLGIAAPDPAWGDHFQVRPLTNWGPAIRGTFRYAGPFAGM